MNPRVSALSVGAAIVLLLSGMARAQELGSCVQTCKHESGVDQEHDSCVQTCGSESEAVQALDSCVQTCRSESGADDCRFDANAARQLCIEQNGCDALRTAYTGSCLGENRDEAACAEGRARFRDCVTPCHEDFRVQMDACMDRMATCVAERCATELPEPGARFLFRDRFDD